MSSDNIIPYKKSFTPKNIICPKTKKHYLNENDKSTDSTEQQCESKALLKPDKIIGNYSLTKKIIKTSYTKVFLAKHILTGEKVTIRIINKLLFKNDLLSMTRFNKELKIIKTIKHQNIIKLLEIIETNSKIYLISEFLPHNLLSYIQSENKLSETKARLFFQQLISSLNYLHLMGISHRNITPENILLDEKYNTIKITGFEVSTFYKEGSLLNSPVGTLLLAPPEMILSKKYKGELNDIWSAGIILYAMLCGRLPFSQENQDVNINHIIEGFYEIPKYISPSCVEVIKACLECNPEKRITFNKLKHLKWVKYKNFEYIKGIFINKENIIVDDIILHECKKYISANNQDILIKIKKSVMENKFDEFSSLYYLVYQKKAHQGYQSFFNNNKNNIIFNYIDITNSNVENLLNKEDLSNNSFHAHTNSFSSFIVSTKNKLDLFDISNHNKNSNIINKNINHRTLKNIKNHWKMIANISSMNLRYKNYIFSPKFKNYDNNNNNNIIDYKYYHNKILNRLQSSELKSINQILSTPKIYTKKTSFIAKPKFLNIKSKSNTIITKKPIITNSGIKIKYKESNESIKNTGDNKKNNRPLNTLFVNRVNNINNFYSSQKRKNKSSEGFYLTSKDKNQNYKTKTSLISINKKKLFININSNEYNKEKNDNNADKILMDDQPVINFSMNFNSTLLDSYNNKNQNDKNLLAINIQNVDINEKDYFNKKSILNKQKRNVKRYNKFDHACETPKIIRDNSNYFKYNYKYNLKTHHYFKLNSSNKGNNSITDSFNKFIPAKKLLRPSLLRNSMNEQYYNTTLYQEEKTLNKIRSFGGLKKTNLNENQIKNFQKNFKQKTFSMKEKDKHDNYNKCFESIEKKIIKKKENIKKEKNIFFSKFNESMNINSDIGVLDITCLKLCKYESLIEKIRNALKKYKIKYCFINPNKIHCSGKTGLFFDIEIRDFNTKNSDIKIKTINNNKISMKKMEKTSFGFKKINNNNLKYFGNKCKGLYYINFISKQIDFRKRNSKLIYDIIC